MTETLSFNATDGMVDSPIPWIISTDDHVIEPMDLWERWLPRKYKEVGPKVIRSPYELVGDGAAINVRRATSGPMTDFWTYGDLAVAFPASFAAAGRKADEIDELPVSYDQMRPGFFDGKQRLKDMDLNHVERSLCFPTFPRFCGQTFYEASDKEVALACVRGYNNWMVEEWSAMSEGRLIPLCLIPLWDPEEAAREVRRNADRGVRAVAFSEMPPYLGLPSIHDREGYWLPFFEACSETSTVVCMHTGSSSSLPYTSDDAPRAIRASLTAVNAQMSLSDWLLSGVLARYPGLRLAYSEGQIGWIPFVLERCDSLWERKNKYHQIPEELVDPPSSYFHRQVFGCFFEDAFGLRSRSDIGIRNITFETDYPHQDGTWPDSRTYAESIVTGLTGEEIEQVLRLNAVDLFGLPKTLSKRS